MNHSSHITDRAEKILSNRGIRPSYPRLRVFAYLLNHRDHPSADTIYGYLVEEIPTLSRTTVYNTLNLLIEKGLVLPLASSDQEVRYDIAEEPHAHFHCNRCGEIYDLPDIRPVELSRSIAEHRITDSQVRFAGICKYCRKNGGRV